MTLREVYMSVLKNKRQEAPTEYFLVFKNLYGFTVDKMSQVPKRKRAYLVPPIMEVMDSVFGMVMSLTNDYYRYKLKLLDRPDQAHAVIDELRKLQGPLLALWNIEAGRYSFDRMAKWAERINLFAYKMIDYGHLDMRKEHIIYILDRQAVHAMEFAKTISQLHRKIYSLVISGPTDFRGTRGRLLMDLADDALCQVAEANHKMPETRVEYERRAACIAEAMNDLYAMQQPMMAMFNILDLSDGKCLELAGLLEREIALLSGLQKSDKERFGNLP